MLRQLIVRDKKILFVLLASLLILMLVGCGKEDTSAGTKEPTTKAETTVASQSDEGTQSVDNAQQIEEIKVDEAVIETTPGIEAEEYQDLYTKDLEFYMNLPWTAEEGDIVTFPDGSEHLVVSGRYADLAFYYSNLLHHNKSSFEALNEALKKSDNLVETLNNKSGAMEFEEGDFSDAVNITSTDALEAYINSKIHTGDILISGLSPILVFEYYNSAGDYSIISLEEYVNGVSNKTSVSAVLDDVDPSTCISLDGSRIKITEPGDYVILPNGTIHRIVSEDDYELALNKTLRGVYSFEQGPFLFADGDIFWSSREDEYRYIRLLTYNEGVSSSPLDRVIREWDNY